MQPGTTGRASRRRRLIPLAGVALVLVATLTLLFGNEVRTLATFREVDGYPLYVMHLYGGHSLGEFLKQGISASGQATDRQPGSGWACTVFAALDLDSGPLLGRNFDWHNRPTLLLFTHPQNGFDSVSMVDISYLGFDGNSPSWFDVLKLLRAPYWPFDGMNEHGLAVGMMAVPYAEDGADPQRATIGSLHAMRLILDFARTVDEAITLLGDYHIDFGDGPPLHYLIADAQGNSAVIEFIDARMNVLRSEESWQVATNFLISGKSPEAAKALCPRYKRAYDALQQAGGTLTPAGAMAVLEDVSQANTMWSVVYSLDSGDIVVSMGRAYEQVYGFKLRMKNR